MTCEELLALLRLPKSQLGHFMNGMDLRPFSGLSG
jgi:hypothetical protein